MKNLTNIFLSLYFSTIIYFFWTVLKNKKKFSTFLDINTKKICIDTLKKRNLFLEEKIVKKFLVGYIIFLYILPINFVFLISSFIKLTIRELKKVENKR